MTRTMLFAVGLAALLGASSAIAQTPPAAPAPGAMTHTAVSKACSAQADTKGLHGKERKKFRAECKKAGGKV